VRSAAPAPTHHGEILDVQHVSNGRIFASRHRPGLIVPDHAHDRACIGFVLAGQCEEQLNARSLDLSRHKLFYRPAGEIHSNRSGRNGLHCLIAEVSDHWLEHVGSYGALPRGPICTQNPQITWLALRLHREHALGGFASALAIEGLMLELGSALIQWHRSERRRPEPGWLHRAQEVLHAHYRETVRLGEVASRAGIHPVHLAREFRKYNGCTVGQYVRKLRVEAACAKLVESDLPLATIALETGFANQAHLSRIFKLVTGLTPARYRASSRPELIPDTEFRS
jgi:AraC family transcriptional regulator